MKEKQKGHWPMSPVLAYQMIEAGCSREDVQVLHWARPGLQRQNLVRGLALYRKHGAELVGAVIEAMESVPDVMWDRARIYQVAGVKLSAEAAAAVTAADFKLMLRIAFIKRPDLAGRVMKGIGGPSWVRALDRSGWRDSAAGNEIFKLR